MCYANRYIYIYNRPIDYLMKKYALLIFAFISFILLSGTAYAASCVDTDEGTDQPLVKGTIEYSYWFGLSSSVIEDYCLDATTLVEHYCPSINLWEFSTIKAIEGICNYGCVDGVCVLAPDVDPQPFEGQWNKVTITSKVQPFTEESEDIEETPVEAAAPKEEIKEAQPVAKTLCTDTDNGRNYYLKGSCTCTDYYNATSTHTDLCLDKNLLKEWECNDVTFHIGTTPITHRVCQSINYNCPKNCISGACSIIVDETQIIGLGDAFRINNSVIFFGMKISNIDVSENEVTIIDIQTEKEYLLTYADDNNFDGNSDGSMTIRGLTFDLDIRDLEDINTWGAYIDLNDDGKYGSTSQPSLGEIITCTGEYLKVWISNANAIITIPTATGSVDIPAFSNITTPSGVKLVMGKYTTYLKALVLNENKDIHANNRDYFILSAISTKKSYLMQVNKIDVDDNQITFKDINGNKYIYDYVDDNLIDGQDDCTATFDALPIDIAIDIDDKNPDLSANTILRIDMNNDKDFTDKDIPIYTKDGAEVRLSISNNGLNADIIIKEPNNCGILTVPISISNGNIVIGASTHS